MKTIYLLRHAKSVSKDMPIPDVERPLAERGRMDAAAMARFLGNSNIEPAMVLCSAAARTRETLEGVLPGLSAKAPAILEEPLYHADAKGLLRRLSEIDDAIPSVMLVGHNPAIENLARALADGAAGGDGEALKRMKDKFPTGALAVLEADVASWRDLAPQTARLTRFIRPRDLDQSPDSALDAD